MKKFFSLTEHGKCPKGFRISPGDGSQVYEGIRRFYSKFESIGQEPVDFYGVRFDKVTIHLGSETENTLLGRIIGQKILKQGADMWLHFDPQYSGHEKADEIENNASDGSSNDPQIFYKAAEIGQKFLKKLVKNSALSGLNGDVHPGAFAVTLPDSCINPIDTFSKIYQEWQKVCAARERGEHPLGYIEPVERTVKINPALRLRQAQPGAPARSENGEKGQPSWWKRIDDKFNQIERELEKYFPGEGMKNQRSLFMDEIGKILGRPKG